LQNIFAQVQHIELEAFNKDMSDVQKWLKQQEENVEKRFQTHHTGVMNLRKRKPKETPEEEKHVQEFLGGLKREIENHINRLSHHQATSEVCVST